MVRTLHLCLALLLVGITTQPARAGQTLTVSAAISLKNALETVERGFEAAHPDIDVLLNLAATGELLAQITGGAPVDVFASASAREMDTLEKAGLLAAGTRRDLAGNELVLVVPAASTLALGSFPDLARPAVTRIAVGNPDTVPAGRYAAEVFAHDGLAAALKDRLIPAGNVRQVLDYVARGEVDAGVVYSTDARARAAEVKVVAVARVGSHSPIVYPVALLEQAEHAAAGRAFLAYLGSPAGTAALEAAGFVPLPK